MKNIIYSLLNLLTLGRGTTIHISGFSLKIPIRYRNYFNNDYELDNINFINTFLDKGMTAIDIGAHIGLMTTIMSKKVGSQGKVYAFEPTPSSFALLEKTIDINNTRNIVVPLKKAVANKAGKTTFFISPNEAHNSNSLSNNNRQVGEIGIDVDLMSIDELKTEYKISKIDLIKIDAEGAEYSVLKGIANTLISDRPKIILSLHPNSIINFGDSLGIIWDFITLNKYRFFYRYEEINKEFFVRQDDLFDVYLIPIK